MSMCRESCFLPGYSTRFLPQRCGAVQKSRLTGEAYVPLLFFTPGANPISLRATQIRSVGMGSRGTNRKVAADQLLLFGKDEWPSTPTAVTGPKSKLMFVLRPTNPVALRMHEDAATHLAVQRGQDAYPPHLLHMSLLCMGQFDKPPTRLIERTRAIAAGIQARPIPITLDSAGLFGNSRHLALYHPKGNT